MFHENETRIIIEPVSRKSRRWTTTRGEIRDGDEERKEANGQRWKTRVKDLKSQATSVVGPGLRFYFIRTFLNGVALTLSVIPLRLGPLFYDETVKSVLAKSS